MFWQKRQAFAPPLILNNSIIEDVTVHEHLGLTLSWRAHKLKIHKKASKKLNPLKPLKYNLNRDTLEVLFKSLVGSSLEYDDVVCDGCCESDSNLLESLQIEGARVITGALKGTKRVSLLNELSWVELSVRRKIHKLSLMYKMVYKLAPLSLCDLCPNFVSERSSIVSVLPIISAYPSFVLKCTKNLFSFHQFKSGTVFHYRHAYCLLQASSSAAVFKISAFSTQQLSFLYRG